MVSDAPHRLDQARQVAQPRPQHNRHGMLDRRSTRAHNTLRCHKGSPLPQKLGKDAIALHQLARERAIVHKVNPTRRTLCLEYGERHPIGGAHLLTATKRPQTKGVRDVGPIGLDDPGAPELGGNPRSGKASGGLGTNGHHVSPVGTNQTGKPLHLLAWLGSPVEPAGPSQQAGADRNAHDPYATSVESSMDDCDKRPFTYEVHSDEVLRKEVA